MFKALKRLARVLWESKLPHFFFLTGIAHVIPTWVLLAWWGIILAWLVVYVAYHVTKNWNA